MSLKREISRVNKDVKSIISINPSYFYSVLESCGENVVEYVEANPDFIVEIVEKCATKERTVHLLSYIFEKSPDIIDILSENLLEDKSVVMAAINSVSASYAHNGLKILKKIPHFLKKDMDIVLKTLEVAKQINVKLDDIMDDLGYEWKYKMSDCIDVLRINEECIKYIDQNLKTNKLIVKTISKSALKNYYSKEEIIDIASSSKNEIDEWMEVFSDDKEVLEALLKNNMIFIKHAYQINKKLLEDELFYELVLESITYQGDEKIFDYEYIENFQQNFIKRSYRLDPDKCLFLYRCEELELNDEPLAEDLRAHLGEEKFLKLLLERVELIPLVKYESLDIDEDTAIKLVDRLDDELLLEYFTKQKNKTLKFILKATVKNPNCIYFLSDENLRNLGKIASSDMSDLENITKEELAIAIQILKFCSNDQIGETEKKYVSEFIKNKSR